MHVLILGAGPTGLSLALSLASLNIPFTIYEARPHPQTIGGAVNLTPTALRYLDSLGVLPKLTSKGAAVSSIEIISLSTGSQIASLDFTNPEYGYNALRVKRSDLTASLLETLTEWGLADCIHWGKKLTSLHETDSGNTVEATFSDTSTARGDLVCGADGIHSATRSSYIDPERQTSYSGNSVAYGFLPASAIKNALPFKDTAVFSSQRGSLLASYCTRERDELAFGVVMEMAEPEGWRVRGEDKEALRAQMMGRFEALAGDGMSCVREMLEGVGELCLYPVNMLSPPAQARWARGRCVLLGDAVHAMPPQGESTGFCIEDAILFAHIIDERWVGRAEGQGAKQQGEGRGESKHDLDIPGLCQRFEVLRKPRMEEAFQEALYRWEQAKDMGWFGQKVVEWVTPWFLWWTQGKRDGEFCGDVRRMVV